ncbi:restriction endonuclease [Mesorhizobium australicum]|uniref:restriction endonuclease n=1 Tax=Mesorhizobium australicum TaxID=536018 RepID=UPI00333581AC
MAEILHRLGFEAIQITRPSKDGGKDILARKVVHDIPLNFMFECKRYSEGNKIGLHTLRSLLGVVANKGSEANIGVLVTTSTFTKGGIELIASESRLDGKDYKGIQNWLSEITRSNQ